MAPIEVNRHRSGSGPALQRPQQRRSLGELGDGGGCGVGRPSGDGPQRLARRWSPPRRCPTRRPARSHGTVVGGTEGDEVLDGEPLGVGSAQGQPSDHAALGVGDHVHGHPRVGRGDVGQQRLQAPTSDPEVSGRLGRPVVRRGHAPQRSYSRHPSTGVGELDAIGIGVAEGGGVDGEHVGLASARAVAGHEDGDAPSRRWWRHRGGRRRATFLVGEQLAEVPTHRCECLGQHDGGDQHLPDRGRNVIDRLVGQPPRCPPCADRQRLGPRQGTQEPSSLRRLRCDGALLDGHEEDLDRTSAEEERGVDVALPRPGAEVQRRTARPQHLPAVEGLTPAHGHVGEERVAGAQPVGVEHHHVEAAADLAGEGDLPRWPLRGPRCRGRSRSRARGCRPRRGWAGPGTAR